MRNLMRITTCLILTAAISAVQSQLAPFDIESAIKLGLGSKKKSHLDWTYTQDLPYLQCVAKGGMADREYYVTLTGPVGRVALAAFEAKKKYLPFVLSDVTAEMISTTLVVRAELALAGAGVKHIVFLTGKKGQEVALQPLSTEPLPQKFTNSVGGNQEANGMKAVFDTTAFRSTTGPFMKCYAGPCGPTLMCLQPLSDSTRARTNLCILAMAAGTGRWTRVYGPSCEPLPTWARDRPAVRPCDVKRSRLGLAASHTLTAAG
jgi:hypothetical protein